MADSEHTLLLEHRLSRAELTDAADELLDPGPKAEVAEASALVQEARAASLSSWVRNDEHPVDMPDGMLCILVSAAVESLTERILEHSRRPTRQRRGEKGPQKTSFFLSEGIRNGRVL